MTSRTPTHLGCPPHGCSLDFRHQEPLLLKIHTVHFSLWPQPLLPPPLLPLYLFVISSETFGPFTIFSWSLGSWLMAFHETTPLTIQSEPRVVTSIALFASSIHPSIHPFPLPIHLLVHPSIQKQLLSTYDKPILQLFSKCFRKSWVHEGVGGNLVWVFLPTC